MRRIVIPLAVLIIVIVVWLVVSYYEEKKISGPTTENFLGLDQNQVDKIEIINNATYDTLIFYTENDIWHIRDDKPRRADNAALANVLNSASNIEVGPVISENPENRPNFNVGPDSSINVKFYHSDELLNEIIVGKMGSGFSGTYIRKPGENEVYLASRPLRYVFERPKIQWLDKSLFFFEPTEIQRVDFNYPDEQFRIFQRDTSWFVSQEPFTDSIPVDTGRIYGILRPLSFLAAADLVGPDDSILMNFDPPALGLTIHLDGDQTKKLLFADVPTESMRVPCLKQEMDETYIVHKTRYQLIAKEYSDLLPKNE